MALTHAILLTSVFFYAYDIFVFVFIITWLKGGEKKKRVSKRFLFSFVSLYVHDILIHEESYAGSQ